MLHWRHMIRLIKELILFALGVVELLLVIRFVLRLLAANPGAEIVAWVYEVSQPFLAPFMFIFPNPSLRGGFALEFTTLFAIFAYAFIGYVVQEVLDVMDRRS